VKKTREEQALVKTTGFAVIELEDEMLREVTGGLEDVNSYICNDCPNNVAGCACPPPSGE